MQDVGVNYSAHACRALSRALSACGPCDVVLKTTFNLLTCMLYIIIMHAVSKLKVFKVKKCLRLHEIVKCSRTDILNFSDEY